MYSDPVPNRDALFVGDQDVERPGKEAEAPNDSSSPQEPSLFRTILGSCSCGGFVETAAIFLRPSDCISCVEEPFRSARSPRTPRSIRKQSSKAKLKLAQKLKENPSREGEVVDVPIKLVKSRSGKALQDDEGQVYDPYRSFDDSISAISALTLDEMARRQVVSKPRRASLRAGQSGRTPPRNGDELLPPPARISSDSSDDSAKRDQNNPDDEIDNDIPFRRNFDEPLRISKAEQKRPTYELIENDIPFVKIKKKSARRNGSSKHESRPSFKKASGEHSSTPDIHDAITPKAKGRKSKRRLSKKTSRFEPQPRIAEI